MTRKNLQTRQELRVTVTGKRTEHMGQVLGSTEHLDWVLNFILGFEFTCKKQDLVLVIIK